jgi:hypothetical protein
MKVPLDGGAPTTLASGQTAPTGTALDGTSVYWVNNDSSEGSSPNGAVKKVSKSGGAPTTLASGLLTIQSMIAVDATSVYWTGEGVFMVPVDGGAPTTLWAGDSYAGVAVDATSVYWTTGGAEPGNVGTIMKRTPR